jgi:hypothetical protein
VFVPCRAPSTSFSRLLALACAAPALAGGDLSPDATAGDDLLIANVDITATLAPGQS